MVKSYTKAIRFHYFGKSFYLPGRTGLKKFICKIFRKEGYKLKSINYIFCSDEYLFQLNLRHLDHNTFTDILTFRYSSLNDPIVSEIYISIDRIKENSKLYNTTFSTELHRVMFHGALHLCNYGDKTKSQSLTMRSKEEFYLQMFSEKKH
jgi:rRNA maturation RNase YbeY